MFFREKLRQENETKLGLQEQVRYAAGEAETAKKELAIYKARVAELEKEEIETACWKTQYQNLKAEHDRLTEALKLVNSYRAVS
jgi:DNA repair exonuclease SbcCD ATPase subunit